VHRRVVLALTMTGFCVAAGTALAAPPLADGPSQRPDITEYLQQAAARGDPEAAAALGRLREFAAAHQVDLTSTQDVRESGKVSDLPVRLSGVAPIFLNIDAYQDLATVEELDAYRAPRHRALDTLAAQSPSREIAAQVVFRGHATIHEAWNALVAADQEATSLMIDVFATIDGRRSWESRFTHHGGSAGDFLRLDDNSV
jgi:hypothetical protein